MSAAAGEIAALAGALFGYFADHECRDDPLYVALCRLIAERPTLLAAGCSRRRPRSGCPICCWRRLHDRVLAGPRTMRSASTFRASAARARPMPHWPALLDDFVVAQADALAALLATRHTQTNEIGRCAVLWPVLCALAQRSGQRRLALLDFGCSAGLNLGVDRYRYDYGDFRARGAGRAGRADHRLPPGRRARGRAARQRTLGAADRGARRRRSGGRWTSSTPRRCAGCAPACGRTTASAPHASTRRWRLRSASALPVRRCDDCAAAIEPWLDTLPADVLPVVFNSWVLHYFDKAARQAHVAFMRDLVQRRGIVWLSAEGAHLAPAQAPRSSRWAMRG